MIEKQHRLYAVLRNPKHEHLILHIAEVGQFETSGQAQTARLAGHDKWKDYGVEFFVRSGPIYPVADKTYDQLLERAKQ